MKKNITQCIDINSQYCPCLLAQTNHCTFCSQLMGKETCDCNWSGLCILYEKHWQHKNNKVLCSSETKARMEEETQFQITQSFDHGTYMLEFELSADFAQQLTPTGSFVFLRCPGDPIHFNFPVGIMTITENVVKVVIEQVGPKSSRVFMNNNDKLLVRGPYYNGILGRPWIDNITDSKVLLVAGGIGQAPALPLALKMYANNNKLMAVLAPGKLGRIFIEEQLKELGVTVHNVPSMRRNGMLLLDELLEKEEPHLVVSAGPDTQHNGIIDLMNQVGINIPMAVTNNAIMCCGEGICGSCLKHTKNNEVIRMCKIQTDYRNIAEELM